LDFQYNNSNTLCENYDAAIKDYITSLEAGKNNVKFHLPVAVSSTAIAA